MYPYAQQAHTGNHCPPCSSPCCCLQSTICGKGEGLRTVASWVVCQTSFPPYGNSDVGVWVSALPLPFLVWGVRGCAGGLGLRDSGKAPNTTPGNGVIIGHYRRGCAARPGVPIPVFTTRQPGYPPFLLPTHMAHSFCEQ